MKQVSTRFILQWGTVYCTVHWWLRVHKALDPESLDINWPRNTQQPQIQKTHHKDKPRTHYLLRVKWCTTRSPNPILFNLTLLFILPVWLWTSKVANVACTSFCSKATELHPHKMWTEFDPVWFSSKENCSSRFTNKFRIITEVFRALGKLHPELLYLTWPEKWIWTQDIFIFRNTTERQIQNDTKCSK